jgi:hypothetical protein
MGRTTIHEDRQARRQRRTCLTDAHELGGAQRRLDRRRKRRGRL